MYIGFLVVSNILVCVFLIYIFIKFISENIEYIEKRNRSYDNYEIFNIMYWCFG